MTANKEQHYHYMHRPTRLEVTVDKLDKKGKRMSWPMMKPWIGSRGAMAQSCDNGN